MLTAECWMSPLQLRQHDPLLRLVLSLAILIAGLADFVRLEEEDLAQPFIGVDLRRQWSGVRDLERDKPFPLRLEWRDVHNDPAARVGGLAHADGAHPAES